jgi:hypothetical protein
MPHEVPKSFIPTEQIPLDFGNEQGKEVPETKEPALNTLATTELEERFEAAVGFDATLRFLDIPETERRSTLIAGITDPEKGREAVAAWDAQYNGIGDPWSRK